MSIFDNAVSVTKGGKEIVSIVVDGGVIYEKTPTSVHFLFLVKAEDEETPVPLRNATFVISNVTTSDTFDVGPTGSAGGCNLRDVPDGEYEFELEGASIVSINDVENQNTFTISASNRNFTVVVMSDE